jgi:hypothetical protein
MTLNEYHITSNNAVIDVNTFFITNCKGIKNLRIFTKSQMSGLFYENKIVFL